MSAREASDGGSYGGGMANMKLAFSDDATAVYKPIMPPSVIASNTTEADNNYDIFDRVVTGSFDGLNMNLIEPGKRKRGRPRKYSLPESNQHEENQFINSKTEFQSTPIMSKKPRGRPPGSGGKNQQALNAHGSTGFGFIPHVIAVKIGEDVFSKVMSFSQNGGTALCILSASGAVSNVTLHQATASSGTITYEGCFEILSLSGSFFLSEINGQHHRAGGLTVTLAGSDGSILGGSVAGLLRASSPVQVIVASFTTEEERDSKLRNKLENLSPSPKLAPVSSAVGSSASRGTLNQSFGQPRFPLNQSIGPLSSSSNQQDISNISWKETGPISG